MQDLQEKYLLSNKLKMKKTLGSSLVNSNMELLEIKSVD